MITGNIAALLRHVVKVPEVNLDGCDVFLWKDGDEIYVQYIDTKVVFAVRDGMLASFIEQFPREKTLCIMNDQTGQPVRISPLAN